MDKEFLKIHGVKNIHVSAHNLYAPYFTIEFENNKQITEYTHNLNHDQIINTLRKTILNNSFIVLRKRKIDKLCGHIMEEKLKL
jgi:ribosomal protein S17E